MHTQQINITTYLAHGTLILAALALFSSVTTTAHASSPYGNNAYQVSTILDKTTEALVIMQESVGTEYDYTKKKENTEYYDYTKKNEYVEPVYKKSVTYSEVNIEQLLEQIQQLQKLILLLIQLQQTTLGNDMSEKQSIKSTVTSSKEALELKNYVGKKDLTDDDVDELQKEWSFVDTSAEILVVGAYQGTLPNGETREFQEHGEGEITVYVANGSGESLLVLSAYEPTHWKLDGEGLENIESILVTGYYDQRVSGVPAGVNVIERIYKNGDSPYFIMYNGKGTEDDDYPAFKEYMQQTTGQAPYLFFGEYEADSILVSLKG